MTGVNKTIVLTALITATPPTIAAKVEVVQKQTDGMQKALTAAALKVGEAKGEKAGVQKGVAVEKARTAAAKENQAKGAAIEKARSFWKR